MRAILAADPATRASRREHASLLATIGAGGALGTSARYGIAQLFPVSRGEFPWATFATNVSGSFVIGLVLVLGLERLPPTRYLRPFVATGFLGAFTTYSTFAVETNLLVKDGHAALGVAYAVSSLVTGIMAAWAGMALARTAPLPRRGGRP